MTPLEQLIAQMLGYPGRSSLATVQEVARLCAPSLDEANDALKQLADAVGETLDKDFGFWSAPAQDERRGKLYRAWKAARAAITAMREGSE